MKMKFGGHRKPCMHGFSEFHSPRDDMTRFGNHGIMKWMCKRGNHHHKRKMMLKGFSSSESDDSSNEETNQATDEVPAMGADQKATQTAETEVSQDGNLTGGSGRDHCGRRKRCGRHLVPGSHGCHKSKLKMKLGKGHEHKDKVIWKCKKDKFHGKREEGYNSMRAMFMDMMCSGRRREMWEGLVRLMTEQESDTEPEGQPEVVNEQTNQEVAQEAGQTSSMDIDPTGTEERNQKDPQSSDATDPAIEK
nr:unnamed protein product [Callosobruchus analis]